MKPEKGNLQIFCFLSIRWSNAAPFKLLNRLENEILLAGIVEKINVCSNEAL